jgi:acetyl esterase/lipase
MALDPRVRRFLDLLAASNPPDALSLTVEQRRAALIELMRFGGKPAPVASMEDRRIGGSAQPLAVRIYTPPDAPGPLLPGLVYFHGGGLVAGSIDTHEGIARALSNAGACRVVSVDYRLAPEHRFPAALEDARHVIHAIRTRAAEFGIDASRLGVCGDSAGATLVAASCQALAPADAPPLAFQLLLCPILDYSERSPSRRELAEGYLVDQATLDHDLLHYVTPGTDLADPRISPLRAPSLAHVPPTLIHTAEFDPLRDEGRRYFERLEAEAPGSASFYRCHPGMIHLFYGLGGVIPYAHAAIAEVGRQLRSAFG